MLLADFPGSKQFVMKPKNFVWIGWCLRMQSLPYDEVLVRNIFRGSQTPGVYRHIHKTTNVAYFCPHVSDDLCAAVLHYLARYM
jgi:hypothetical protein